MLNDADAAGVAEMTFGAGVGQKGTVLMLTFGTGIGSALFTGGLLVPNTEFGHIEIRGHDAETRASERAKELHDLSWGKWAGRVDEYLQHIEALLSPHLIIVGGGVSKQSEKWVPRLTGIRARVVPAVLLNDAGIVGAAMATSGDRAGHLRRDRNRQLARYVPPDVSKSNRARQQRARERIAQIRAEEARRRRRRCGWPAGPRWSWPSGSSWA